MSYCSYTPPRPKFNQIRLQYFYSIFYDSNYIIINNSCTTISLVSPSPTLLITEIQNNCISPLILFNEGFNTVSISGNCPLPTNYSITSVRTTLYDSNITGACSASIATVGVIAPPSYIAGLFQETINNSCTAIGLVSPSPTLLITEIQNNCITPLILFNEGFNTVSISGNCPLPTNNSITSVRTTLYDSTITGACINASI